MKKIMSIAIMIAAGMLLLPLAVVGKDAPTEKIVPTISQNIKEEKTDYSVDTFRVLDKESGKITKMSAKDYIFGVVAAEMPALYEIEALKAQAVASYTYACYKRAAAQDKEYDITTDYTVDQSFKTKERAISDWGKKADEYAQKIENAIDAIGWNALYYEDKPILAVYHALSCGNTYAAKDVWGKEISYLQSVSCDGDKLASNYISTVTFTKEELKEKFSGELDTELESKTAISNRKTLSSGLVEAVTVFGTKFTGAKVRSILNLPSSNFSCTEKGEEVIFTVYGNGHGVGMSQNGANYMAKQGYNYKEILKHFYKGAYLRSS